MICKFCGFNDELPIGKALENIQEGNYGSVELNENGVRAVLCIKWHIKFELTESESSNDKIIKKYKK